MGFRIPAGIHFLCMVTLNVLLKCLSLYSGEPLWLCYIMYEVSWKYFTAWPVEYHTPR